MGIIDATFKFLDELDNSKLIRDLKFYKNKALNNKQIIELVDIINKEEDNNEKIRLRKKLYLFDDYKKYMERYNELSLIIMKINYQYREYTNTRECINNGDKSN